MIFSCLYAIVSNFNLQNYGIKNKLKILSNSEIENIFWIFEKIKNTFVYLRNIQHALSSIALEFQDVHLCPHAKSLQSCPIMCDPMDCSPPGSSVHGILQARILAWVTVPSSRGFSWPRNQTCISYNSCIGRWVFFFVFTTRVTKMYIHQDVYTSNIIP